MTPSNLIEATQVRESGSANLASIWAFTAIADEIDAHLALGRFDGRVRLPGWNGVSLGIEKEMMNESFHVLLHRCTGWWCDLVIFDLDRSGRHLVETLMDDSKTLSELLHAAKIAVVAVAIGTDGDIELHLVIRVVRLTLPYIPWHPTRSQHGPSEAKVQGISG